jgi:hypothetical protein
MGRIEKLANVPKNKVENKKKQYEALGATVKLIPQSDGKYTIEATFPNGE